jgi:hypothetical protein
MKLNEACTLDDILIKISKEPSLLEITDNISEVLEDEWKKKNIDTLHGLFSCWIFFTQNLLAASNHPQHGVEELQMLVKHIQEAIDESKEEKK